ncbi:MAG: cytidine deaminase [Anaerolineae bacterium]
MLSKESVRLASSFSAEWQALLAAALDARSRAYAPYSRFPVGAAVQGASGRVYQGCNVENVSSGLTVCAERVAIWTAVAAGETALRALALVTEPGSTPCGACRQVMQEFARNPVAGDLPVLVADTAGHAWLTSLAELLPVPFPTAELAQHTAPDAPETGDTP